MRLRSGFCFSLLLALPLYAQFTEKVDVSLVNVDVTVTSRGVPARGLTRDDFELLEDGVAQPIVSFDAIENDAAPSRANAAVAEPRFRRRVLVIVDMTHTSRHNRNVALTQLERFVDEHFNSGEYDWSIAVATRRMHLVLPPSSDKDEIHRAIADVRRMTARGMVFDQGVRQSLVETEANLWQENYGTRDSVDAVVQAVRAFTDVPGRKCILLLTGGLGSSGEINMIPFDAPALAIDTITRLADSAKIGNRLRDILVREANASNVTMYVMNPEGLAAPGDMAGGGMTNNGMSFWIAEQTGGRMLPGNDPRLSLQEFDRTSANFYSIAYRPPHGDDGKYHRIEVRLKRRGPYAVQHRTGYVSAGDEVQLVRSISSPLTATMRGSDLPVAFSFGQPRRVDLGVIVPLHVEMPPNAQAYVSIFDANGAHISTQRLDGASGEVRFDGGKVHRVVVGVRDPVSEAVGIAAREVRY